MQMIYQTGDKPVLSQRIIFALQQMLAILAATITVPIIIGNGLTPASAMFGAGIGTIVYWFFTKRKSPVFLGSSFAFIGSMVSAFAGGVSIRLGLLGLILGAALAGLIYVILAAVIKAVGIKWINTLMPPVVIGSTVAVIGLSLAGSATSYLQQGNVTVFDQTGASVPLASPLVTTLCGLFALAVVVLCSTFGKKTTRLIPFIYGILAGYALAAIFTVIGNSADIDELKIIDFSVFRLYMLPYGIFSVRTFFRIPDFVFIDALKAANEMTGTYFLTILAAYVPVAFVCFAEHIADHKNLSSIIGKDLLEDPGLSRTLLGDGIGSIAGAFFGGCPNTTYGESIACVALTGNASAVTILYAAFGCILFSFITPFVAFIASIPSCVMGGVCVALYGFIAVSGLKMLQGVDFDDNRNLFTASVILVAGIGGLTLNFGAVSVTAVATALILGILTNLMLRKKQG